MCEMCMYAHTSRQHRVRPCHIAQRHLLVSRIAPELRRRGMAVVAALRLDDPQARIASAHRGAYDLCHGRHPSGRLSSERDRGRGHDAAALHEPAPPLRALRRATGYPRALLPRVPTRERRALPSALPVWREVGRADVRDRAGRGAGRRPLRTAPPPDRPRPAPGLPRPPAAFGSLRLPCARSGRRPRQGRTPSS